MKKFNVIKTTQLIVLLVYLAVCAYLLIANRSMFHDIAHDRNLTLVSVMLWAGVGISLVFLILDYRFLADYKRDYRELDFAVHSDPLSGLANRNSCDAIIEQYLDKPLPRDLGAVMLELTNIRSINQRLGHTQGNAVIRDFSNILKMSSVSLCFVGRNGGNKFLAIFEESSRDHIEQFLARVEKKITAYNQKNPEKPIAYSFGVAFDEPEKLTITELVALSNRRLGQ